MNSAHSKFNPIVWIKSRKGKFSFLVVLIFTVSLIFVLWPLSNTIAIWQTGGQNIADNNERVKRENEIRTSFIQLVGGAVILMGVYFTWRRTIAAENENTIQKAGLITDKWDHAIGHLNTRSPATIIGSSIFLRQIAREEVDQSENVANFVGTYLREHLYHELGDKEKTAQRPFPQSFSSLIKTLEFAISQCPNSYLDLSHVDLRNAEFRFMKLPRLRVIESSFSNYRCWQKWQSGVLFPKDTATFTRVDFHDSLFVSVQLSCCAFQYVDLTNSKFVESNLAGAIFRGNTDLTGADFATSEIDGCDFSGAIGLTKDQFSSFPAIRMKSVKLPDYLSL